MEADICGGRGDGKKAWLIRWDWSGEHAKVDEPIVAILPIQWGVEKVKTIVDVLHDLNTLTPAEMAYFAGRWRDRPYKAALGTVTVNTSEGPTNVPWEGIILCGHNPWLEARQVMVFRDAASQSVAWEPLPMGEGGAGP